MVRKTTVVGKFWNNKNVLITGFEGFLGSNMTKRMIAYNANVVGLDIVTGRKESILTKEDYRKMKVINGSVTDMKTLRSV
ncbi:MAG TPA: NAD-dependent epimerase/dehydratase family protein, partial [Candidatus Omnitrophota bacterium]|nr:NAD-dependent epimerase/dehydratase family protein [Candidatus Omnitrophota bacterium]